MQNVTDFPTVKISVCDGGFIFFFCFLHFSQQQSEIYELQFFSIAFCGGFCYNWRNANECPNQHSAHNSQWESERTRQRERETKNNIIANLWWWHFYGFAWISARCVWYCWIIYFFYSVRCFITCLTSEDFTMHYEKLSENLINLTVDLWTKVTMLPNNNEKTHEDDDWLRWIIWELW